MKYEILNTEGSVINTIIADESFCKESFTHYRLVPEPVVTPTPKRILSKLEYMNLFTDAELAGIYTAAKSVISVEIWLERFKLATEINLDDPATVAGLQAMEAGGLLAAGRSAAILA